MQRVPARLCAARLLARGHLLPRARLAAPSRALFGKLIRQIRLLDSERARLAGSSLRCLCCCRCHRNARCANVARQTRRAGGSSASPARPLPRGNRRTFGSQKCATDRPPAGAPSGPFKGLLCRKRQRPRTNVRGCARMTSNVANVHFLCTARPTGELRASARANVRPASHICCSCASAERCLPRASARSLCALGAACAAQIQLARVACAAQSCPSAPTAHQPPFALPPSPNWKPKFPLRPPMGLCDKRLEPR